MDLRALAIRAVLIALLAAIVGTAAYVLSERQPERYDASIRLSYAAGPDRQALGLADPTDNTVRLNTEAAALESYDLAVATSRATPGLGLSADEVADRVSAAALPESQVVQLVASGATAQEAVQLLEAYRDQYLQRRRRRDRAEAREAERALRARLSDIPRSERNGALAGALRLQLGALAVVRRVGTGIPQPLEAVRRPTEASAPQTRRNTLFGVLFGLAAGIGLVAMLPRRGALGEEPPLPPPAASQGANGATKAAKRRKAPKR
jgi:capsular polysaccharide biosynthesis protein